MVHPIIYTKIVQEMKARKETQSVVAEILGITRQNLKWKLDGRSDWTISDIEILCEHFNKNYYELFK